MHPGTATNRADWHISPLESSVIEDVCTLWPANATLQTSLKDHRHKT